MQQLEEFEMQISRHWRMNAQRYRLEGMRTVTIEVQPPQRKDQAEREQVAVTARRTRSTAAR
ncbi:MAG TPA: hypothetical protein VER79_02400 [Candidatus Limnocylindrales bacterium]|nr:hypothetical protein [Candidatus Limnocylindrales bacterium]